MEGDAVHQVVNQGLKSRVIAPKISGAGFGGEPVCLGLYAVNLIKSGG
jgi:hypothetical protein